MRTFLITASILLASAGAASAATLTANTTSNNGGSTGWGIFFDLSATTATTVTELTTASTAAAGATFNVEVFTRSGTSLGATGANGSSAGWTSLGTAIATQGAVLNEISLPINIPDITVGTSGITGVAVVFTGAGPRYLGSGTAPLSTFTDGPLTLVTGDVRSVPFTTGGSYFSSRALSGSLTYSAVPEPTSLALVAIGGLALARRRRVS